jgi:hypothetical protein
MLGQRQERQGGHVPGDSFAADVFQQEQAERVAEMEAAVKNAKGTAVVSLDRTEGVPDA